MLAMGGPAQAQDPAEIIMKYFCEVAGLKPVEEGTCEVLCQGLEQLTEVPEALCMPLMEKGWEYLEQDCTNVTAVVAASADPTPADEIEKLLCKLAKSETAKEAFASKVCAALVAQEKIEQEACDMAFEKLWDEVSEKCPSDPPKESPEGIKDQVDSLIV